MVSPSSPPRSRLSRNWPRFSRTRMVMQGNGPAIQRRWSSAISVLDPSRRPSVKETIDSLLPRRVEHPDGLQHSKPESCTRGWKIIIHNFNIRYLWPISIRVERAANPRWELIGLARGHCLLAHRSLCEYSVARSGFVSCEKALRVAPPRSVGRPGVFQKTAAAGISSSPRCVLDRVAGQAPS